MMPLSDDERAQQLFKDLNETVAALRHGEELYREVKKNLRRMRVTLWVALIGLILDLTLSLVLGLALVNQSTLSSRINDNANTLHDVECSTNSLFISTNTPDQRAKAPDPAKYDAQFHIIYQQRIQLGCQPAIPEPKR
jgi:hypothetical protein